MLQIPLHNDCSEDRGAYVRYGLDTIKTEDAGLTKQCGDGGQNEKERYIEDPLPCDRYNESGVVFADILGIHAGKGGSAAFDRCGFKIACTPV